MITATSSERPVRVLIADDHPTNRAVLEVILSFIQAELVTVEDGAQALEAFKTGNFDIVLMDLQMPVMDGVVATRRLAVSANAMSEHVAASRAAGADQHIAKPVIPDALLRIMGERIRQAATPQSDHRKMNHVIGNAT